MLPHPIAATLTLLCVWMGLGTIDGKCAGKWAIHACGGGNGKRSEPGAAVFPSAAAGSSPREVSLKQVLLSLQREAAAAAAAPQPDSDDGDDLLALHPKGERADDFYAPAAGSHATSSVELPPRGGYMPMAEMVDEYQREEMDDLQRQYDEQKLRSLWSKLIASLKSRRIGRH